MLEEPLGRTRQLESRIRAAMHEPVVVSNGKRVQIVLSTGVGTGDGAANATEVLARADGAMYRAKRARAPTRLVP